MDMILAWGDNCDYPPFRAFIQVERKKFNQVIVVWVKSNQEPSYKEFVVEMMRNDRITFVESPEVRGGDWRNVAVNAALEFSTSPWVWFTEQDVFVTSGAFWGDVLSKLQTSDAILYEDNGRIHPCMAFVKRSVINQTKKDFGVVKDKSDHFSKFFAQLQLLPINIAWVKHKYFYHMHGLSHNLALLEAGKEITYKPDEFKDYLNLCLQTGEADERFIEKAKEYL